jgi:hypothetical protein
MNNIMLYLNNIIEENDNDLFFIFQNDYFIPCIKNNKININKLQTALNVINVKDNIICILDKKFENNISTEILDLFKFFNLTFINNDNIRNLTLY